MHYFTLRIIIFLFLYLHCKKILEWDIHQNERCHYTKIWKISYIQKGGLKSPQKLDSIGLTWFQESNLFHQCLINFYQTHTCISSLLAFTLPFGTSVTVHVIAQKITDTTHVKQQWAKRFEVGRLGMSNNSELRNLRSEGTHSKNKYKFMVLKNYLDATNKGSIC